MPSGNTTCGEMTCTGGFSEGEILLKIALASLSLSLSMKPRVRRNKTNIIPMKTRNNDSTQNETLLNQNITRRSFVKRGAVASAATVFGAVGINPARADVYEVKIGNSYVYQGTGGPFTGATYDSVISQFTSLCASSRQDVKSQYDDYTHEPRAHNSTSTSVGTFSVTQNVSTGLWTLTFAGPVTVEILYQKICRKGWPTQ